jgi:hypothetical protein
MSTTSSGALLLSNKHLTRIRPLALSRARASAHGVVNLWVWETMRRALPGCQTGEGGGVQRYAGQAHTPCQKRYRAMCQVTARTLWTESTMKYKALSWMTDAESQKRESASLPRRDVFCHEDG